MVDPNNYEEAGQALRWQRGGVDFSNSQKDTTRKVAASSTTMNMVFPARVLLPPPHQIMQDTARETIDPWSVYGGNVAAACRAINATATSTSHQNNASSAPKKAVEKIRQRANIRLAAWQSRERKRIEMEVLQERQSYLKTRNEELKAENAKLRKLVAELRGRRRYQPTSFNEDSSKRSDSNGDGDIALVATFPDRSRRPNFSLPATQSTRDSSPLLAPPPEQPALGTGNALVHLEQCEAAMNGWKTIESTPQMTLPLSSVAQQDQSPPLAYPQNPQLPPSGQGSVTHHNHQQSDVFQFASSNLAAFGLLAAGGAGSMSRACLTAFLPTKGLATSTSSGPALTKNYEHRGVPQSEAPFPSSGKEDAPDMPDAVTFQGLAAQSRTQLLEVDNQQGGNLIAIPKPSPDSHHDVHPR